MVTPQRTFGEKLRRAREDRGVSLEAIAQSTKIGATLLASLERGDCSRWPSGVYSRAYVRSYAQTVGLDPKAIADEFCNCFPTVAWPDGPPGPFPESDLRTSGSSSQSHPDQPQYSLDRHHDDVSEAPLRLTLDPMPSERWRLLRSGVTARLAECAAGVLVAAAASLFGMDFWMALSAASLAVQARHFA
ncbi:MAG: helix-turn-helix domain-containing protein [Vicinamibacterales bacterium]